MIDRVVHALRALSAQADLERADDPPEVARLDELARDYSDALRLLADCPQVDLSAEQQGLLERLEDALEALNDASHASPSAESAMHERDASLRVRELARAALLALGQPVDHPPTHPASERGGAG